MKKKIDEKILMWVLELCGVQGFIIGKGLHSENLNNIIEYLKEKANL